MLVVPSITTFASEDESNASYTMYENEDGIYRFYFDDSGEAQINADLHDPEFGDERNFVWLTDLENGDHVQELVIGESYELHVRIVNDGHKQVPVENVIVDVGYHEEGRKFTVQEDGTETYVAGQEYSVGAVIRYNGGRIVINTFYPIIGHDNTQSMADFKRISKAKLYNNGGRINGAQVNHAQLILPHGDGILIGYDDQDGILPYGKEYACEIRMKVRLVEKPVPEREMRALRPKREPDVPADANQEQFEHDNTTDNRSDQDARSEIAPKSGGSDTQSGPKF